MRIAEPHPVDVAVGRRIEAARCAAGRTLKGLAPDGGVNWQQLRKFETAANRVTMSGLWGIVRALNKPMTSFVDGLDNWRGQPAMRSGK